MSQFEFINKLNSAVRMDEPITKGPVPRWQKKAALNNSNLNSSTLNSSKSKTSLSLNSSSVSSKTPKKHGEYNNSRKTPSKTPSKTPKKSPGCSAPNTPGKAKTPSGGDRFIPARLAVDFELAQYKICQEIVNADDENQEGKEKRQAMVESLSGCNITGTRILEYQKKAPPPPDGYQNALKVVYSQSKTPMSTKASRYIPHAPERILDAPEIVDDYYLNLIDWNTNNILAVALANCVYLWYADTGKIEQLVQLEGTDYACSLNWDQTGNLIGVGTSLGKVQIWDVTQMKRLRVMDGHSVRVSSLSWNSYILSSGSRSGQIIHHDVRQREHNIATLSAHSHEVCGLKWSPDGRYLASGGNDNLLNIWQGMPSQATLQTQPLYQLSAHQAAVKALAWCPWSPSLLASGGGTADRRIRFWNCNSGVCISDVDTRSQVCSLLWSTTFKELVSAHGFANNQLIIWKYPSMTKVAELTGHTARVLHLALSPDGTTVLSAGADETLRMWRCFVPDKKKEMATKTVQHSILKPNLR